MQDRDPRAVLGLPLDATRDEAQRAFRRLAKQTHPDAGGNVAAFRVVAGAWADLGTTLPPDRTPPPRRRAVPSPHVRAYRPPPSRLVWAEPRPSVTAAGANRPARPGADFATVLEAELSRLAS